MDTRTFIILGGAGDLARRLLLPGIAEFSELYGEQVRVIGVGREEVDYPAEFIVVRIGIWDGGSEVAES